MPHCALYFPVLCHLFRSTKHGRWCAWFPTLAFSFIRWYGHDLTTGTMIVMWLGEMITEFGLGNGISIIIMAGIIAALPAGIMLSFSVQLNDGSGV